MVTRATRTYNSEDARLFLQEHVENCNCSHILTFPRLEFITKIKTNHILFVTKNPNHL